MSRDKAQSLRCRPVEFTLSPPEWSYSRFPLAHPQEEQIRLEMLVERLQRLLNTCTEADSTPRGVVLHVAHMLVSRQGADGAWPAEFNLLTGKAISEDRSTAPVPLFRRLNEELNSTEFNFACARAEAGVGR
jgi:hypothetical protein